MQHAGGRPAGFDYLRLSLATAILCWHSVVTCYGLEVERSIWVLPYKGFISSLLPMFFALSGILVAGSLERTRSVSEFLWLRAIRIFPALALEVTLAAFVLGPIFTQLTLSDYFESEQFWAYFGNVIGQVHFFLPGVFATNPFPYYVNVSLWTLPSELECYLVLAVACLLTLTKRPWLMAAAVASAHLAIFLNDARDGFSMPVGGSVPPRIMVLDFLTGVVLYQVKDIVRVSFIRSVLALVAAIVLLNWSVTTYATPLLVAYGVLGLGSENPVRVRPLLSGDYSYGLYLYAFPIEQAFAALFPAYRIWYVSIVVCLTTTAFLACLSWHFVERPFLRARQLVRKRVTMPGLNEPSTIRTPN